MQKHFCHRRLLFVVSLVSLPSLGPFLFAFIWCKPIIFIVGSFLVTCWRVFLISRLTWISRLDVREGHHRRRRSIPSHRKLLNFRHTGWRWQFWTLSRCRWHIALLFVLCVALTIGLVFGWHNSFGWFGCIHERVLSSSNLLLLNLLLHDW